MRGVGWIHSVSANMPIKNVAIKGAAFLCMYLLLREDEQQPLARNGGQQSCTKKEDLHYL